jgi:hypothetical protein
MTPQLNKLKFDQSEQIIFVAIQKHYTEEYYEVMATKLSQYNSPKEGARKSLAGSSGKFEFTQKDLDALLEEIISNNIQYLIVA